MVDQLYVRARAALLDAVDALEPHLDAVVLVGAQAIYLHTGNANLAVAEYTTDADFSISPGDLADAPLVSELLEGAGFQAREHPGGWLSPGGIYVDLMVPEVLAGPGRRGADLGLHGRRAARRAKGLKGALVDRERQTIRALDDADDRHATIWVAGSGALLIAKVHKIAERLDHIYRARDKDALDVLRLLRAVGTEDIAARIRLLRDDERAGAATAEALEHLPRLFGDPAGDGVAMAVRATGGAEDEDVIAGSLGALVADLGEALS